jgi:CheY-like chemotaxis protein
MADARPVLVVDDDPTTVQVVEASLRRAGYEVVSVSEPRLALGTVLAQKPCVVLLDLQMPGVDGITLLGEIRRRSPVPVVMLTATDRSASAVRAIRQGAFEYLTKPIDFRRLVEVVGLAVAGGGAAPDREGIGRYEIVEELGRGGMGLVYEALDRTLDRRVALKVLRPEFAADAKYEALFLAEARAAAKVSHPALVTVYEAGRHRGSLFMAMEYVDGWTLHELRARGQEFEAAEALRIVVRTAEGLEAAHAAGLRHGDVKPSNIMLGPGGGVKLLDFGVARPMRAANATAWESRYLMGTPGYVPPESVLRQPLDARSDVYSLGVVLYELLSGEGAFIGDDTLAVLTNVAEGKVRRLLAGMGRFPSALCDFVARLMAVKPEDRPGSMAEVIAAARRLGATSPS